MSADKSQKPRRDLRARLGRTITPKGGKGGAPAEVAPPPGGIAAPPPGIGGVVPPSADIAPPPFARSQRAPEPEPAGDPFVTSAPAQQQQVVRLEFDERPVTDEEVGRKQRMKIIFVAAGAVVAGMVVGWGVGQMLERRSLFNRTVVDAQAVYGAVDTASADVLRVQELLNTLNQASLGNRTAGEAPRVDYDSIEALRGIEKPFQMNAFTNRNYNALGPGVVNNLFTYVTNIERIWQELESLANETLPTNRREELDQGAAEAGVARFAVALVRAEDGSLSARLAFAEPVRATENGPRFNVRPRRGARPIELTPYTGAAAEELSHEREFQWGVMVDNAQSAGVLRDQKTAFERYKEHLGMLRALVEATASTQGALIQSIASAITDAGQRPGHPE